VGVDRYGPAGILLLVLLLAGCDSDSSANPPAITEKALPAALAEAVPRTATMALPERTNNAWEMAPFQLRDLEGNLRTLADWKGRVIMMNFWASWCAPCQYEIPEFVHYQKDYGEKGLQIVGIGVDARRKLANVARSLEINYPVLVLEPSVSRGLMAKWGNDTGIIPYTVVIARDGRISYIHRGQMGQEEFDTYVKPLL
jgi:thiol-disulfide isomerase/thioredoxin